jgi:putative endonuclease
MVDHLLQFLRKSVKFLFFIASKNEQKNTIIGNSKGAKIERLACDYLQSKGLSLLQRNFLSRFGEIDLIMQDENTVVFIEVRYRKNCRYGGAAASVTWPKQQRIIKTALSYQQLYTGQQNMRFDVVAVEGTPPKIVWIKNAFSGGNI